MKKWSLAMMVLVMLVACSVAFSEEEQTYICGDYEYAIMTNGDAELLYYCGKEGASYLPDWPYNPPLPNVYIPNELDGHPITAVRQNPFSFASTCFPYTLKGHFLFLIVLCYILAHILGSASCGSL